MCGPLVGWMPDRTEAIFGLRGENSILNEVSMEILTMARFMGGEGLRADGRVILTPFVLPGEKARVEVQSGVHADLEEVLVAAPERAEPPCPLFRRCGGCHYQHVPYDASRAKSRDFARTNRCVGKIEYNGATDVEGPPLGYRNRVQVHVEGGKLGYRAARSHDLIPLTGDCPVASPRLNQALAVMRERLTDPRFPNFVHSLELFTDETDVQVNVIESDRAVMKRFFEWCESKPELDYVTTLGSFRVSPRSFFQVNRFLIEKLVETALGASTATVDPVRRGWVGLFALPMATPSMHRSPPSKLAQRRPRSPIQCGASRCRDDRLGTSPSRRLSRAPRNHPTVRQAFPRRPAGERVEAPVM